MQIVSYLHEMSKPVLWESISICHLLKILPAVSKYGEKIKMLSADNEIPQAKP